MAAARTCIKAAKPADDHPVQVAYVAAAAMFEWAETEQKRLQGGE